MQADQGSRRKLAAILSADAAGYSRLMGEDETATLGTLAAYREVFRQRIAQHSGRLVDTAGDSVLAVFDSVVEAVGCAAEIQQALHENNLTLPETRRMQFRVGVNLGDVIEHPDGSIYGDGVNLAARLQTLSDPGGLCISGTAYDQIRNKIALTFDSLGEKLLKNIAEPVRVYRLHAKPQQAQRQARRTPPAQSLPLRGALFVATGALLVAVAAFGLWKYREGVSPGQMSTALPLPDKPSIAVLPFANMSGDPKQEYFSDGMTENIITGLSKRSGLFVIARNSVFTYKGRAVKPDEVSRELGVRYVLEGSVQKAGNRVRITAQLIDAPTGYHVWAESYDGELKDIFALQDAISQKIVVALSPKLAASADQSLSGRPETTNVEAYDLVLRAIPLINEVRREPMATAHQMLQKAVALDPNYARAYALMTWFYFNDWSFHWTSEHARGLDRAFEVAKKSVAMDGTLSDARVALGWTLLWKKQHDLAIAEMEKAVVLDPNNYDAHALRADVLNFCGRPLEAIASARQAMRLDPNFPFYVTHYLGNSHYILRRYDEAIAAYQEVIRRNHDFAPAHAQLAAIYAELGRDKEARDAAAEVRRLVPRGSTEFLRETLPFKNKADLERIISSLRKAGLE